jgi:hypothetical protein
VLRPPGVAPGTFRRSSSVKPAEWATSLDATKRDLRPSSVPFYKVAVSTYLVPNIGAMPSSNYDRNT